MKFAHLFALNSRLLLLGGGIITIAGNVLFAAKISRLWPMAVSIFFSVMDIYTATYSILHQFISWTGGLL
jgi:hypothetical protein